MSVVTRHCAAAVIAAASLTAWPGDAAADYTWNWTMISNPNWEIMLTDFGYSDYLFDKTPGYEGREYLSGEWGAALGYRRGSTTVTPTWLEPRFSFPDWDTNSNYSVVQPMTLGPLTAQGLPTMSSVISNGAVQITQDVRFVDTVTGIAMGNAAASLGGGGTALLSNRYVMTQTYTFQNVSGTAIDNLQFLQFLHGLNSQSGVYDNRAYGGQMGEYRYDVTMGGVDPYSAGGQVDYIAFHSKIAPSAVEIGRYGIEGVDDHVTGKPSVGTHLSVESNNLSGVDSFAPPTRWVAGAQRYDLGTLDPGAQVSFDVALSILSGWQVGGGDDSGTIGGTSGSVGSVDYLFLGSHGAGEFTHEFSVEDADGVAEMIALGEFGPLTFGMPGGLLQLWDIGFEGSFNDGLRLTFHLDTSLLPPGADPENLRLYHWTGGSWQLLAGGFDPATGTITIETDSLSPFAVGAVPEPGAAWLLAGGLVAIGLRLRRRR